MPGLFIPCTWDPSPQGLSPHPCSLPSLLAIPVAAWGRRELLYGCEETDEMEKLSLLWYLGTCHSAGSQGCRFC